MPDQPFRDEGYVKFQQVRVEGPSLPMPLWENLERTRSKLYEAGLVGMYDDGIGFGNVSWLAPDTEGLAERHFRPEEHFSNPSGFRPFVISGTQTGRYPHLTGQHYVLVTQVNPQVNQLQCKGPVDASSESMTHAAVYAADLRIGCVLHVHHAGHWSRLLYKVPTTAADVPYGTPAMAEEVGRLFLEENLGEVGCFAMAGHEEGLVSFGSDTQQALARLAEWGILPQELLAN